MLRNSVYENDIKSEIEQLGQEIREADAIVIGAGAGLSTSAGLTYDGARYERYFADFHQKYGIRDMYSGGFYPYDTLEEFWGFFSRQIYVNRYLPGACKVYKDLLTLVKNRDYFVLTTNVDHQFQLAGFDKKRLFYTQGDYGLWQCGRPCHQKTYDNEKAVREMLLSQGYLFAEDGDLIKPEDSELKMTILSEMVPHCPLCGASMTMNLRGDDTFVEDEGWHLAAGRYEDFLRRHEDLHILFLELGVGGNTPGIIKYPFWQMTLKNPNAVYVCINYGEAFCPREIRAQSVCIDADIGEVITQLIF